MELDLRNTFPAPTAADWLEQARAELKGEDPAAGRPTVEGLRVPRLSPRAEGFLVPGRRGAWQVRQEIRLSDPARAREAALEALRAGADALEFRLDAGLRRGQDPQGEGPETGLQLRTAEDAHTLLDGLDAPVGFFAGAAALPLLSLLRTAGPASRISLGMNPLGQWACGEPLVLEALYDQAAAMVGQVDRVLWVGSGPYHEAGASTVQELAFSMATGLEYVRELTSRGVGLQQALDTMEFGFPLSPRLFPEIARLRAARLLWARIAGLLGGSPRMLLSGHTDRYSMALLDPSTNLLRTTVAAFAGALGGCDSLTVGAMDALRQATTPSSRRWARNQQLLLMEEAQLHRVEDPGAGAHYLETLTEQVAREAWALFQEVEAAGGMRRALEAGMPQERVAATSRKRADLLATGRKTLVGVTKYVVPPAAWLPTESGVPPQNGRKPVAVGHLRTLEEAEQAARAGATLAQIAAGLKGDRSPVQVVALPIARAAAPFERMQARAALHSEGTGVALRALMAVVGSPKMGRVRADFVASMLASGGFVTVTEVFPTVEEAAKRAQEGDYHVVVACAEDGEYAGLVPDLAQALERCGAVAVLVVAGLPPDADALRQAGAQDFLHRDTDRPQALEGLMDRLGVDPLTSMRGGQMSRVGEL